MAVQRAIQEIGRSRVKSMRQRDHLRENCTEKTDALDRTVNRTFEVILSIAAGAAGHVRAVGHRYLDGFR